MKKLITTALLAVVAPTLMAATANSNMPNAAADYTNSNAELPHHIQFPNAQSKNQQQDSASLSSGELGLSGPVSFTTTYSATYGWMLSGKYTQGLGQHNAISLLLTGGAEQQRANLTWGVALAKQQRIKLTAEYLRQKMDFDFDSGDIKKWEGQQAYGAAYQYVIPHYWLNAVNVDVNYSDARTQNLSNKLFDNGSMENFRRIAGGRDIGTSAGVSIVPNTATLFNLAANYDDVKYDTKYEKNQDESGLGATLNLQHLLTKRVKWQLLASQKVPVSSYGAELDYLLPTASGTQLQLAVNADRDLGKGRLANDFRVGAGVHYAWGGNSQGDRHQTYQLGSVDSVSDLHSWTATPAVEKPQILAILDQKSEAVTNSKTPSHSLGLSANPCSTYEPYATTYKIPNVEVGTNQSIGNHVLGLVDQPSSVQKLLFHNVNYEIFPTTSVSAKDLPAGLKVEINANKQIVLSGKTSATIPAAGIDVSLFTTVKVGGQNYTTCPAGAQHVLLKPGNPSITLSPSKTPWIVEEGHTAKSSNPFGTAELSGGDGTIKSVTVKNQAELEKYGIEENISSVIGNRTADLKFTGTSKLIPDAGTEDAEITLTNSENKTVTEPLTIESHGKPVRDGNPDNINVAESSRITTVDFSDYFAKANQVSLAPNKYEVTMTDPDGQAIEPSALNLTFNATSGVLTQEEGKSIPAIKPEFIDKPYKLSVTANNDAGTSIEASTLELIVGAARAPSVTPNADVLYLHEGETATDANSEFAKLDAGPDNATIESTGVTFTPELKHGLSVALEQTQPASADQPGKYDAYFTGKVTDQTKSDALETFTVSAKNSLGKEGSSVVDAFKMAVLGPPVRNRASESGGDFYRGEMVEAILPSGIFSNYFSSQVGKLTYYLCPSSTFSKSSCLAGGQPGNAATDGLSIDTDGGAIKGTIPSDAAEGTKNLYVFAANEKGGADGGEGVSTSAMTFTFSVQQTTALRCPRGAEALSTMTADGKSFTWEGHTFSIIDAPGSHRATKQQFTDGDGYFTNAIIDNTQANTYSCVYAVHNLTSFIYYNAPNIKNAKPVTPGNFDNARNCGDPHSSTEKNPQDCAINYQS